MPFSTYRPRARSAAITSWALSMAAWRTDSLWFEPNWLRTAV